MSDNPRYDGRWRGTLDQARSIVDSPSNMISHILANDDGTFSVMSHIVCEFCDYCEAGGVVPFPAKADPYENQRRDD
jgi:hypothetical protein